MLVTDLPVRPPLAVRRMWIHRISVTTSRRERRWLHRGSKVVDRFCSSRCQCLTPLLVRNLTARLRGPARVTRRRTRPRRCRGPRRRRSRQPASRPWRRARWRSGCTPDDVAGVPAGFSDRLVADGAEVVRVVADGADDDRDLGLDRLPLDPARALVGGDAQPERADEEGERREGERPITAGFARRPNPRGAVRSWRRRA